MSSRPDSPDSRRFDRLEQLFFAALEQPEDRRARFLDDVCGSDARLRSSVEAMLRADQEGAAPIDTGPWQAARVATHLMAGDPLAVCGAMIGPYEVVERIGAGGMGTVWRARRADGAFDRDVAIKLLKRGMDSEEILRRFRLERQVLARLEHPNIARLYDGGAADDGRPYLVMECIEGVPIDEYCCTNDLSVDGVLDLVRAVCSAVHFAHTSLVLHRDIKPANVLVTADGRVKLLDFGIAKLLDNENVSSTLAGEHAALTPRYASPEQILGQPLSTASDVYSLGVLLYELLTGQSPYEPHWRTRRELERAVLKTAPTTASAAASKSEKFPPARRRDLARRLRGDLDAIVAKALQKSPANRYGSVEQLGEDIRRTQEGLPLLARGAGPFRRAVRTLRRHRKKMAAMSVVAASAVLLTATTVTYLLMAPHWAQERVREAHGAFLTPDFCNQIWVLTFNNNSALFSRDRRPSCPVDVARAALQSYDAALRLDSGLDDVRIERDTIWLAAQISSDPRAPPNMPESLLRAAPLTCEYARMWGRDDIVPDLTDEQLELADTVDLRCLGLLSMLCGSGRDCLRAWSRLGEVEQDPLVEALLGVLYLALDRPERAYPPLLSAYRAHPELGFLCTYLADAALRCGDVALAERLIERAKTLDQLDPLDGLKRVRLQYYLATGQDERAEEVFFSDRGWANHVARTQYARHLFESGSRLQALAILGQLCGLPASYRRVPAPAMRAYIEMMQRWWTELDEPSRAAAIQSLNENTDDDESVNQLLRVYQRTLDRINRYHHDRALALGDEPLANDALLFTDAHAELLRLCAQLDDPVDD